MGKRYPTKRLKVVSGRNHSAAARVESSWDMIFLYRVRCTVLEEDQNPVLCTHQAYLRAYQDKKGCVNRGQIIAHDYVPPSERDCVGSHQASTI